MSEPVCLLCKKIIDTIKYNIDQDYTKYSNLLLRTLLEGVFEHKIILTSNLPVCAACVELLNELDLAESTYKRIRLRVLDYLGYNSSSNKKSNAYCQTDVFIENVLEFDVQGKYKSVKEESRSSQLDSYSNKTCDTDTDDINNYRNENLSKKYECHICFKKFSSKNGATLHTRRVHNLKRTQKSFENKEKFLNEVTTTLNGITQLQSEIVLKDEISLKNELAEQINTSFTDADNFEENISDFSDPQKDIQKPRRGSRGRKKKYPGVLKPYKCTSCPKTWKTLGELKSHLSAHSDARPFICEICGQAYKHKTALDIHVGMHNGIYPFMCMYCKKSFTQKGALQRHLPIHTGETPYQCDLCGKRFVHHTSFNIHQLSHSGQKDYKCAQCGLALLSGSHLKRHMRVHTGERNYACPFCGKRFAERYNLASHQKLHENPGSSTAFKRNHRCQICGTTFNRRLKLDEHMAKDHQKITESDVPFIQQLFTKNDTESIWNTNNYNSLKTNVPEATSY